MRELVESPALRAACPVPFDEARLWQGADGPNHREELRLHFRNISAVMDCVGCEKCRLWGKLQTLGLGTALKVRCATRCLKASLLTCACATDPVFAGSGLRVP